MATRDLKVFLNEYYVGMLSQVLDGRSFFIFDQHYLEDLDRPTLSLSFKNAIGETTSKREHFSPSGKLPPFFSNLLPEGKLRSYLARKVDLRESQEFLLLQKLSSDLPGAVLLRSEGSSNLEDERINEESTVGDDQNDDLRFSVAGVQLKFSGDLIDNKIVIPAHGIDGHWIVKLPSQEYSYVNELEYSMLNFASEIGIIVPEFNIKPMTSIANLPTDFPTSIGEGNCLLSRRFDRTTGGGRIHMEDFAQVFSVYEKYDERFNYQSIAKVIWVEMGLEATLEFVRRLVYMFAIGNADMHLKNWSIVYPDCRQPELSPAYDLVSTVVYPNISKSLPHKMAGVKSFDRIGMDAFRNFAKIAELPEKQVLRAVNETIERIHEAWPRLRGDMPIPESFKRSIENHMETVPLLKKRS
ncbi:MAG: HipA domain-containing protein [Candidatus Melainabacteria bacterium]|nr:HipA domain-containing protein [Candidatus Melainabacteria bacterium]